MAAEPSRRRLLLFGSFASAGARGIAILVGFASVPLGVHHFGATRYGLWMLIISLVGFLGMSQLGIGSAAGVLMAKTTDAGAQRLILRQSAGLLGGASILALAILLGAVHLVPNWTSVFGATPPSLLPEASGALLVIAVCTLLGLPTTAFSAGFYGLQQVYWVRAYETAQQVVGFGALIATVLGNGSLITLALLSGAGNLLVGVASGIHLRRIMPAAPQSGRQGPTAREILGSGGRFFVIGLASMIVWSTDNLVIAQFLGPEAVTAYATTFRLFANGFAVVLLFNGVVSPLYGRASAQDHWDWIDATYQRATAALPVLAGLLWLGGMAFAEDIIRWWVGPVGYGGALMVMAMGLYGFCLSLVSSHTAVLGALNLTRPIVWLGWAEAGLNLGLSLLLVRWFGGGGVAFGTALASLLTVTWVAPLILSRATDGRVRFRLRPVVTLVLLTLGPALAAMALVIRLGPSGWPGAILKGAILAAYVVLAFRGLEPSLRAVILTTLRRPLRVGAHG